MLRKIISVGRSPLSLPPALRLTPQAATRK
ncbi:hypothetical protein ACVINI_007356 [Rhizobium beringeri]